MELTRLNTCPIDDKYWEVLEEYSYETSKGLKYLWKTWESSSCT